MNVDEAQLIVSCQQGKLEDFALLYDSYSKKIYNFIYFRTHHKETAEDLLSLTFTKALENINKFDRNKASFSTWLYQISRNTIIDHFRTLKLSVDIQDAWDLPETSNIERDFDTIQSLEKAKEYLGKLPQQQRDIIVMRVWDGLSHKEIAQVLDITEANSKMTFSRGLAKLNKDLVLAIILFLTIIKL